MQCSQPFLLYMIELNPRTSHCQLLLKMAGIREKQRTKWTKLHHVATIFFHEKTLKFIEVKSLTVASVAWTISATEVPSWIRQSDFEGAKSAYEALVAHILKLKLSMWTIMDLFICAYFLHFIARILSMSLSKRRRQPRFVNNQQILWAFWACLDWSGLRAGRCV